MLQKDTVIKLKCLLSKRDSGFKSCEIRLQCRNPSKIYTFQLVRFMSDCDSKSTIFGENGFHLTHLLHEIHKYSHLGFGYDI